MRQQLLVKIRHLSVANLANRISITCDWRLDLARSGVPGFDFAFEWRMS
jgi:hypothetical protein